MADLRENDKRKSVTDTMRRNPEKPNKGEKKAGVVTADATYSLSPDIHGAGIEEAGLLNQIGYYRYSVSESELPEFILGMRNPDNNFSGVSIGTPHKEAVIPLLDSDSLDPAVIAMGACNTVVVKKDAEGKIKLHGKNTDFEGFKGALEEESVPIKGAVITIWGAKGAARSTLYAAGEQKATKVYIVNRTRQHAEAMKQQLGIAFGNMEIIVIDLEDKDAIENAMQESSILVNATKVGMKEKDETIVPTDFITPLHTVVEWVYHKDIEATDLETKAAKKKAKVIPGRRILLYQAITQFEEFTGFKPAPKEAMDAAIPKKKLDKTL